MEANQEAIYFASPTAPSLPLGPTEDGAKSSDIPGDLMATLIALKPVLEVNGVVQCRSSPGRQPHFRLRYRAFDSDRGYVIHRSLSLRSATFLASAVENLIQTWKFEYQQRQDLERQAEAHRLAQDRSQRLLKKEVLNLAGDNWRHRKMFGEKFDAAFEDPIVGFRFFYFELPKMANDVRNKVKRPGTH